MLNLHSSLHLSSHLTFLYKVILTDIPKSDKLDYHYCISTPTVTIGSLWNLAIEFMAVKQIWENDPIFKNGDGQQGQIILWAGVNSELLCTALKNQMHTVHECICVCALWHHTDSPISVLLLQWFPPGQVYPQCTALMSTHSGTVKKCSLFLPFYFFSYFITLFLKRLSPFFFLLNFFPLSRYFSLLTLIALIFWQENLHR